MPQRAPQVPHRIWHEDDWRVSGHRRAAATTPRTCAAGEGAFSRMRMPCTPQTDMRSHSQLSNSRRETCRNQRWHILKMSLVAVSLPARAIQLITVTLAIFAAVCVVVLNNGDPLLSRDAPVVQSSTGSAIMLKSKKRKGKRTPRLKGAVHAGPWTTGDIDSQCRLLGGPAGSSPPPP